ncbi:MAG: polyphenol oxidase family protein [Acidobacteria bacterium]|nr:polyphenol oxidase family protein [Acidobacteriota bacterium]
MVHRSGRVRAAFLGVLPGGEAPGPEDALRYLTGYTRAAETTLPAWLKQRHGAEAVRVEEPGFGGDGDALIVSRAGVAATVFVADCVPVLIAAGENVAAVHAGWRGLASVVLASAIRELELAGATVPARAEAWVGPAIGPCCYEVDDDVAGRVESASDAEVVIRRPGRKPHLDLPLAASIQLAGLGVARVTRSGCCVRCDPNWWSYRRDGARAGRNHAFIWRTREVGRTSVSFGRGPARTAAAGPARGVDSD